MGGGVRWQHACAMQTNMVPLNLFSIVAPMILDDSPTNQLVVIHLQTGQLVDWMICKFEHKSVSGQCCDPKFLSLCRHSFPQIVCVANYHSEN